MSEQRNGWKTCRLDEPSLGIGIQPGFACGKKDIAGGIPHLRMNNISSDGLAVFSLVRRIPANIAEQKDRWLENGDVLFCNTNSTDLVGKTCLFRGWEERCTFSNHLTRLRIGSERITPEWLTFCIRNLWLNRYFAIHCTEFIGQSSFNKDNLQEIEIPVPPLEEQRRIVSRIEELTRRADQARRLRQQAIVEVRDHVASAVSQVLRERDSDKWVEKSVGQLCEKPQYGYTESATREAIGPRFLRITDIQDGGVDWENVPYCTCDDVEKYELSQGDIVFARTGATTGKSFLIRETPEVKAVFASYLIRLRAKDEVEPEYLYWYFQSSSYWQSVASGVEDGNRPNMNGTKLARLRVPYPKDRKEQRRIVQRLDHLRTLANSLTCLQTEIEAELAAFTPALLAKAFRGEL